MKTLALFIAAAAWIAGSEPVRAQSPQSPPASSSSTDDPAGPSQIELLRPSSERFLIRELRIETADVYPREQAQRTPFYRLVNALHWTTREAYIRRELWFGAGDRVNRDQLAELERNLRGTGLFASVVVHAEPIGADEPADSEARDVVITTSDRLSLLFSASGAITGGVGSVSAALGETNLFGRGDRVVLNFARNDRDEETIGLSFTDRHFLHPRLRLSGSVGETEEGGFWSARLDRRFQHLEDPWAWSVGVGRREDAADFFELGSTVAEVPRRNLDLSASVSRAWGARDAREVLGLGFSYDDTQYGALDPAGAGISVPGDTRILRLGPFYRFAAITGRHKVQNLDTLDFVQDIELGWWPQLGASAVLRDEEGDRERLEPLLSASLRSAHAPWRRTYFTSNVGASWRTRDGDTVGRALYAALHAFHFASARHTLAASFTFDDVLEREGLPAQLTLGEDNGLRGYPARNFTGERRARFNLEDRIDTGLELRSIHVDLVAFADAGWVDGEASSPKDVLSSVGFGLRLGSSELFGAGVLRVDLAFPLNDAPGVDDDFSLSVAFGQVFTFFGNSSSL